MSEKSITDVELTTTEQEFKKVVETAMAKLPRFIFRAYHSTSGGYADLNTTAAITPLAFSIHNEGQQPPSSFYKLKPGKIASITQMHLTGGRNEPTIFSSWSQSLSFVLELYSGMAGLYLSVLDTTLLDPSVVVLHTNQIPSILPVDTWVLLYPHELLAYGVIRGRAYQAVSVDDISRALGPGRSVLASVDAGWHRAIAALYNKDFKLAIAAFYVASRIDCPGGAEAKQSLLRQLSELPIPAGWERDHKIMNPEESILASEGVYFEEAMRAVKILRELVRMRTSREVLSLRIETKGWDKPSSRLRSGR